MTDVKRTHRAPASVQSGRDLQVLSLDGSQKLKDYAARHPDHLFLVTVQGDVYYANGTPPRELGNFRKFLGDNRLPVSHPGGREFFTVFDDVFQTHVASLAQMEREQSKKKAAQDPIDLLSVAIEQGASDIHYEARSGLGRSRVRYRIHGELRTHAEGISLEAATKTIRSFFTGKELGRGQFSDGDANDGTFDYRHSDNKIYNIRLNSIPSVEGMKMVCRIRDPKAVQDMQQAGYSPAQLALITRSMRLTEGLLLICGPTNSGKSTTVTSLLHSEPETRCIIELADPIEAVLENTTHVDMAPKGEDAEGKRDRLIEATVRQDTDILCLGEIRNRVTADAAEQLAEQGKLVISTLHTASVTGVHSRLEGIGMGMHLLATPSFFRAAVAQRLVPLLCPKCATALPNLERHEAHRIGDHLRIRTIALYYQQHSSIRAPGGPVRLRYRGRDPDCKNCRGSGIVGRTLVAEAMEVDAKVRSFYASRDTSDLRRYLLAEQEMESIHEHALGKIMRGLIDPLNTEDRIEPIMPLAVLPKMNAAAMADWGVRLALLARQGRESDRALREMWQTARAYAKEEIAADAAARVKMDARATRSQGAGAKA